MTSFIDNILFPEVYKLPIYNVLEGEITASITAKKSFEGMVSMSLLSTCSCCVVVYLRIIDFYYLSQGYFLLHMVESEGNKDLCLVALNPVAATGKVIKRFTLPTGQHINWWVWTK